MATASKPGGYGKRPMWQWVLIYLVVGAVVYGGVYYWYAKTHPGTLYGPNGQTTIYDYGK